MLFQEICASYENLMNRDHWKWTLTVTFWQLLKFLKLKENSTAAFRLLKLLKITSATKLFFVIKQRLMCN